MRESSVEAHQPQKKTVGGYLEVHGQRDEAPLDCNRPNPTAIPPHMCRCRSCSSLPLSLPRALLTIALACMPRPLRASPDEHAELAVALRLPYLKSARRYQIPLRNLLDHRCLRHTSLHLRLPTANSTRVFRCLSKPLHLSLF
jgi:hypothetical protein